MNQNQTAAQQLAQTLALRPAEADHRRMLAQLNDYIVAQLSGQEYRARFPELARHLDACVECAEAYQLLYGLALAEGRASLPQPARQPAADLAFLSPVTALSLLDQVRAAVQRLGERIRLQLTPDLLPALRLAYAPSTVRGPADELRYAEVILRLEQSDDLVIDWPASVVAYRDGQNLELCLVEVTVEPPGRSWPHLEGIEVALTFDEEERVGQTDAWGLVSFTEAPVAKLAEMKITIHKYN